MKRLFLLGLIGLLLAGVATPGWTSAAGPVSITLNFQWIRQGRVGLVHVNGPDVTEVRAVFQDRVFHFFPEDRDFVGLISADMISEVGPYTMQLWVKHADGNTELIDQEIEVNYGEFGRSDVTLSPRLVPLLDLEIETAEMDRLFNIMDRFTPERYWEESGFIPASGETVIGYFGTWRLYNETYWRRHTGIDVRMPIGTPVIAIADGRVMLAEELAIRGGYVLLDHGWSVYSGYAHLSEPLVVPGQWVHQGDVIALSGMNGRSGGAHLHWEMAVGGAWIDPDDFIALGLGGGSSELVR